MANIRDLRQRITSVGNIQKITRAMEMVATTKLRRFQEHTVAAKPYTHEIEELVRGLSGAVASEPESAGDAAPLFSAPNPDAPVGVLLIGSDRGLCGAYNASIQRALEEYLDGLRADGREFRLYVIGRKAMDHAKRMNYTVEGYFDTVNLEAIDFSEAAAVSNALVSAFRGGQLSELKLGFTSFVSMVKYDPKVVTFLPIAPAEADGPASDAILEPGGPELLGRLVPRYLETRIYHALLESVTSEYASRRFAMKNATDAAGDMKKDITRLYNRARQAKITAEITEIVSGAEAL
ncbi:MAG: ATP synthase F1 subunit gamma [Planctomycetes bacterium]|nr:ATP synthase F1 subunit gamma [Planctomycetota bacterium]